MIQARRGIRTERQQLLLVAEPVLQAPKLAPAGLHQEVQAASSESLKGSPRGLARCRNSTQIIHVTTPVS